MTLPQKTEEKSDKKMFQGSFAASLVFHGIILLIIGSIVIVPGAMKKFLPVSSVPTTPVQIPEPPKVDDSAPSDQSTDAGGSPIGDVPEPSSTSSSTDTTMDALTVASPVNTGPSMNATPGASSVPGAFTGGKGGSGGGTGTGIGTGNGPGIGKGMGKGHLFGTAEKIDNSLIGKIYDFKQTRDKHPLQGPLQVSDTDALKEIVQKNFSPASMSKFFSPSNVLYMTHLYIPTIDATEGPKAFGVEKTIQPVHFMVHYRASVAPTKNLSFRFAGYGDDWLIVALDNKVVFDGSLFTKPNEWWSKGIDSKKNFSWNPPDDWRPQADPYTMAYGEWIEWKANEYKTMDILICESGGGVSSYDLSVQEKDQEYEKNGYLVLPLFRVTSEEPDNNPSFFRFKEDGPIFKAKHLP